MEWRSNTCFKENSESNRSLVYNFSSKIKYRKSHCLFQTSKLGIPANWITGHGELVIAAGTDFWYYAIIIDNMSYVIYVIVLDADTA